MEEKILNILKNRQDKYISGEELSVSLGVSRSAVWKHIEKLRNEGYDIIAQPHLGYSLSALPDKLLPQELSWRLNTKLIGKKIYYYNQVASTNDIAYSLANNGGVEGTVVAAETQTKGRGRMERVWISPEGKGIYLSIILKPQLLPQEASKVTAIAAVSVCEAIRRVSGLTSLIKWPNDILINGRKVCGILTEMNAEVDTVKFLVVGIGVNVYTDKTVLPRGASSLKEELKKVSHAREFDYNRGELGILRLDLAREILRVLDEQYELFKKKGFQAILSKRRSFSAILGSRVKVILQGRKIEGLAQEIDSNGALILRLDNGFNERIITGDVIRLH